MLPLEETRFAKDDFEKSGSKEARKTNLVGTWHVAR